MKKFFYILSVLALAFTVASCEQEEVIKYVDAQLVFNAPASINGFEASFGVQSLQLKETNTGNVIDLVKTVTKADASAASRYMPTYTAKVAEGLYTIEMKAIVNYVDNDGDLYTSNMISFTEGVEISEATAANPFNLNCYLEDPKSKSGFVLAEVFFTGSETPEHKQYSGDSYFVIYNNSDKELSADGLTIAESEFMTVSKEAYTPDIMSTDFAAGAIYRIPVGSNVMVKPGESILLVDNAINHKEKNSNSFDLTTADFEWYDESSNPNFTDVDNKDVPNMERIYTYSATIWSPHNRGFKSYVLCRLGDSETQQLSKEDYLKDYTYQYSYNFIYPGGVIPMERDAFRIPNKWILDAVNLSVESKYEWIITDPSLDRGWTYCGKVDSDKTRYGKSVRRKVVFGKTLKDTNNSSVDFLPEQKADPFFKFHE